MARGLARLAALLPHAPGVRRKPVVPAGECEGGKPIRDLRYVVFGIASTDREVP